MSEYMMDPIERGEARCERWADDNVVGDKFKCGCGQWCPLDDGECITSDPYGTPVCRQCFAVAFPDEANGDG